MNDTSGQLFETPLLTRDRASSSWRTFGGISALDSTSCLAILPTSGSMRNGAVFTSAEIGAPHRRERLYIAATPNPAGVGRDGRAWAGLRRSGRVEPAVDRRGHLTPLLPTPTATMAPQMRGERSGSWQPSPNLVGIAESGHDLTDSIWWPAVQRWATVTGTTPPPFVHVGPKGGRMVDARFVEWMMGYRAGWVTDLGLSNSRALKLLGNSVQPQTARLAIRELTQRLAVA